MPCPQLVLDAADRHGFPGDDLHLFVPYLPRRAYKRVTGWLRPVIRESGISDFHPHMLRHWYCTTALREGVAERHVQASMRHAAARPPLRPGEGTGWRTTPRSRSLPYWTGRCTPCPTHGCAGRPATTRHEGRLDWFMREHHRQCPHSLRAGAFDVSWWCQ